MANYEQGKMKRKDMDAFCEDLFNVSLCPPATKIRRLKGKAKMLERLDQVIVISNMLFAFLGFKVV
ncbi:hypothetical protein HPP92_026236 [Vanilla planifolia]|uniref:Uncharacterized protein n=1 Tax=Vanilla planifolia TaxID=51239 RepID=A0A835PCZ7_VANPL|nr:hypothetical protein HPP92_026236 [Vanilla planifolia]